MKKTIKTLLIAFAGQLCWTEASAQNKLYNDEFPLSDITLLDGPLKRACDLNIKVLLQYDCDRLLAPYLKEAGLEPRKPSYPNPVLKTSLYHLLRMEYLVKLLGCQKAQLNARLTE